MVITLEMPKAKLLEIRGHLLPKRTRDEQAGFLFARPNVDRGVSIALTYVDWVALSRNDFEHQSPYHLELRDETRARVIKRAHDLQCSLVEFHSHPGPWPAQFSASDFHGFDEFVPHVLWRLKGRPYVAVVVAPSGLDALAWITSSRKILGVSAVMLDNDERVVPTGLSLKAAEKGVAWTD